MFDVSLPEIADLAGLDDTALVNAVRGWARVENAACARKLAVMAELFVRRTALSAEDRELWWVDPEAAVTVELAAAGGISRGMALHQTHRGVALRDRLPKVAALFEAGLISDALVRTIVWNTDLIIDPEAMAAVDTDLAKQVTRWGALSVAKTEAAVHALIDRHDPGALRLARASARTRNLEFGHPADQAGVSSVWGRLHSTDAVVVQARVDELARSVCEDDPRTLAERRADALAAMATGATVLACECGQPGCPADPAPARAPSAVVHVVADQATVDAALTGDYECAGPPAFVLGGGILPAPLLAATLERATIRLIRHPGVDAPIEPQYRPSAGLAEFVRCRDLTCRWNGCDVPASAAI